MMMPKKALLRVGCAIFLIGCATAAEAQQTDNQSSRTPAETTSEPGDIVVTARQRSETLVNVPVAVTAIGAADIARGSATNLSKIAELSPGVIISNIGNQGGGSVAIRGISSPANSLGFEQAVSVSVDGVQTSNGYIASVGYFDLEQVEILKGPQALLFGKNSPAGVISLHTAQPTSRLYASIRAGYEFVADEALVDAVISGPLTDTLGARLAVRGRTMKGWLYNDARPIADNPFIAGPDRGIPGAHDNRVGDDEIAGRLTLRYDPGSTFNIVGKVTYDALNNQGGGSTNQSLGVCPTGRPNLFGVLDPYGECRADNHVTSADAPPEVAATLTNAPADGRSYGRIRTWAGVITTELKLGDVNLTGVTGYNNVHTNLFFNHDQTSLGQLFNYEDTRLRAFSQEIRALTAFAGPFNVMMGGFYQDQRTSLVQTVVINDSYYNPATGKYETYDKIASLNGRTFSAFAQGILKIGKVEATGGLRWTDERKSYSASNLYGYPVAAFPPGRTVTGTNGSSNFSPEATVSWHPVPRSTIYAAYRTGYKSGSFNLTSPIQATTVIDGVQFGPEKAHGFEVGAKGSLLSNRLFLDLNIFNYKYSNLQVNSYNPALIAYITTNVGSVSQHGVDLQARYDAAPGLKLRGSVSWVHNRFHDFVGQCYGYTYPAGDTTSPPPPNCRFRAGTRILEQDFEGKAPARSPEWSGNAGATYSFNVGSAARADVSGDAFYSDAYFASETMALVTRQPAFWRFNAGVTLHAPSDSWSVGVIGRNLTNKYYLLFAADGTGGTSIPLVEGKQRANVARGREVALQLSYKF